MNASGTVSPSPPTLIELVLGLASRDSGQPSASIIADEVEYHFLTLFRVVTILLTISALIGVILLVNARDAASVIAGIATIASSIGSFTSLLIVGWMIRLLAAISRK
jgi:hypothetical protein